MITAAERGRGRRGLVCLRRCLRPPTRGTVLQQGGAQCGSPSRGTFGGASAAAAAEARGAAAHSERAGRAAPAAGAQCRGATRSARDADSRAHARGARASLCAAGPGPTLSWCRREPCQPRACLGGARRQALVSCTPRGNITQSVRKLGYLEHGSGARRLTHLEPRPHGCTAAHSPTKCRALIPLAKYSFENPSLIIVNPALIIGTKSENKVVVAACHFPLNSSICSLRDRPPRTARRQPRG